MKTYRCVVRAGGHGPPQPTRPKAFRPCRGGRAPAARPGLRGEIPHASQCTNRLGVLTSTTWSASVFTRAGGAGQRSGGETFAPSQVNRFGIAPPERKAGLVSRKEVAADEPAASATAKAVTRTSAFTRIG